MRKYSSEFSTSFVSEGGSFIQNKDYFAFIELDDFACWVVADGIDSEEEINSAEIAVKSIFADFSERPTMSRRKIEKYIINANKKLGKESRNINLQASLLFVITDYTKIIWAVSGNARLYHNRKEDINFRSKDQSLAQAIVDSGEIGEYEIDFHPERNNLLNYLGIEEGFKPFVSKPYKLIDGDIMIMGTSGFWENLNNTDIISALKASKDSKELVDTLEEKILERKLKVVSNYTIVAIFVDKAFIEKKKNKMVYVKRVAAILIPIIIMLAIVLFYRSMQIKKMMESRTIISKYEKEADELVENGYFDDALEEYNKAKPYLKSAKNTKTEASIDTKANITKLIVSGDKSFEGNDYEKAKNMYIKARIKANNSEEFDTYEINKRIEKVDNYINILEIKKEGDKYLQNENYTKAKATYEKARASALKIGFEGAVNDLKSKLDETNSKIAEIDKEKKEVMAKDYEKKGDKKLADLKYEDAIKLYTSAQEVYQEVNNIQGVLSIERKIASSEEAIKPKAPDDNIEAQPK